MDEVALRQLVRDVVSRHLQQDAQASVTAGASAVPSWKTHTSHVRFDLAPTSDGACIVEPAVPCNHCGYCQSMGH